MSAGLDSLSHEWARAMLRASWQGALAALVVALLCLVWRRIPNGLRCSMWWLVGLKLLFGLAPAALSLAVLPAEQAPATPSTPYVEPPAEIFVSAHRVAAIPIVDVASPQREAQPALVLLAIWLGGAVFWGGWSLRPYFRARRLARRSMEPASGGLQDEADAIHRLMGLRSVAPRVRTTEAPIGVLTVGVLRPTILFAEGVLDECSPEEIRMILAHEIAHLRRLDGLIGLIPQVAQIVFFFHPAVWYSCREYGLAREALCDEAAVATLQARPEAYGGLLLKFCSHQGGTLCTPGVSSHFRLLRRRITMLEGSTRPGARRRRPIELICAAIALVLTSASLVEARRQTPAQPYSQAVQAGSRAATNAAAVPKGSSVFVLHKQSAAKVVVALRSKFKANAHQISALSDPNAVVVANSAAKAGIVAAIKKIDATASPLAQQEKQTAFKVPLKFAKGRDVYERVSPEARSLGAQFVSYNPTTNSLVFVGPASMVAPMTAYVRQLDVLPSDTPTTASPANVTMVIPLANAPAETIAKDVAYKFGLVPGEGAMVDFRTNSLTLIGPAAKLAPEKAYALQLDGRSRPGAPAANTVAPKGSQIVVFPIHYANAAAAAQEAQKAFAGRGVRISADDYSNTVIVSGEKAKISTVRDFLMALDAKAGGPAAEKLAGPEEASDGSDIQPLDNLQTRVFHLTWSNAVDMAKILHQTYGPSRSALRIAPDPRTNSVVVSAPPEKLDTIGHLVDQLDHAVDSGLFTQVYKLQYAQADDLAKVLMESLGDEGQYFKLSTDKRTNSLIVSGNSSMRERISKVVQQLDVPGKN